VRDAEPHKTPAPYTRGQAGLRVGAGGAGARQGLAVLADRPDQQPLLGAQAQQPLAEHQELQDAGSVAAQRPDTAAPRARRW